MQNFNAAAARELQKDQIQQASDKQVKTIIEEIQKVCARSEVPIVQIRSENLNSLTRKWFADNGFTVEFVKIGTHPPTAYTKISW